MRFHHLVREGNEVADAQAKKRIDRPALLVVLLCNFACGFFWVYFWHSILIFLLCVCNFFFFLKTLKNPVCASVVLSQ